MDRHQTNSARTPSHQTESLRGDHEIVDRAASDLAEHFHFRRYLEGIELDCLDGELNVRGRLPSYYLKQLLQTVLRAVPGVKRVNNQIAVVSANGLSDSA